MFLHFDSLGNRSLNVQRDSVQLTTSQDRVGVQYTFILAVGSCVPTETVTLRRGIIAAAGSSISTRLVTGCKCGECMEQVYKFAMKQVDGSHRK